MKVRIKSSILGGFAVDQTVDVVNTALSTLNDDIRPMVEVDLKHPTEEIGNLIYYADEVEVVHFTKEETELAASLGAWNKEKNA